MDNASSFGDGSGSLQAPQAESRDTFPTVGDATVVRGQAGSGKTEFIVKRARDLVSSGVDPRKIGVFAASPDGELRLSRRLLDAHVPVQAGCSLPRRFALSVLRTDAARRFTGRSGHVLLPFEEEIFFEDMKPSGLKPQRIAKMLSFFRRGLSYLLDSDPNWLVTVEERQLYAMAGEVLDFTDGMVADEVSNRCVRFLQANPDALEAVRFDHVLVDDYQQLSKASQQLLGMVARESLTVTVGQFEDQAVFERFPHREGDRDLLAANPDAQDIALSSSDRCRAGREAARFLRASIGDCAADAGLQAPRTVVEGLAVKDARDEFAEVARHAEGWQKAGESVFLAVPNRTWARGVCEALSAKGIPYERAMDPSGFCRDFRDVDASRPAEFYTALRLAADTADSAAWRSWMGFGDYLASSNHVLELRHSVADAPEGRLSLAGALAAADHGEIACPDALLGRYREGMALAKACHDLRGDELADRIEEFLSSHGGSGNGSVQREGGMPGGGPSLEARGWACSIHEDLAFPAFRTEGPVRVGSYDRLLSCDADHVVLCGFVNGFLPKAAYFDSVQTPPEQARKQHVKDVRYAACLFERARLSVEVSSFKQLDAQAAQELSVQVDRFFVQDGRRKARVSPSELWSGAFS